MLQWKNAFLFPTADPNGRSQLFRGGLWFLLCPPLGWLLALGYRSEVALRLWDGAPCMFPAWRLDLRTIANGGKAAGIIYIYFLPVIIAFWIFAADSIANTHAHWIEIACLTLLLPCFLPGTIAALFLIYPHFSGWMHFDYWEIGVLAICFVGTMFILPAAFLRVSIVRRFAAALSLPQALKLIFRLPRLYCEAWAIAISATGLALLSGPFFAWGIPWSYLVIGYGFNEALMQMNLPEMRDRVGRSIFAGQRVKPY
jgi:hypothetical protein